MTDFSEVLRVGANSGVIQTNSFDALGANHVCALAYGSAAWPTANKALFVPFRIFKPITVTQMMVMNGGTVSGNLDLGIYNLNGSLIVSKGSTAQSGINAPQLLDITDTPLQPGHYFMACAFDGNTGTTSRSAPLTQYLEVLGVQQMLTAFPLPSTATFANPSSGYIPQIAVLFASTA